jgi:hypothetical protein
MYIAQTSRAIEEFPVTSSLPSSCSSWLNLRVTYICNRIDSRNYQEKKVVGLERGPLSLVSTTEELLDRKVAAPV